jgi:hypothetical protein
VAFKLLAVVGLALLAEMLAGHQVVLVALVLHHQLLAQV